MKRSPCLFLAILIAVFASPLMMQADSPGNRLASERSDILIGAWYFGGWWRSPCPAHYFNDGLDWRPAHPERQPVTGWFDDTKEIIDEEISLAAAGGLDFFAFDWYPNRKTPFVGSEEHINGPLEFFVSSPNKALLRFAILYVNEPRFGINSQAEWDLVTDKWIAYFQDPQYLKINNKPVLMIISVGNMRQQWGGAAGAHRAIELLRKKAGAAGFNGILIGGGLPSAGPNDIWAKNMPADGYDFLTQYNIPLRTFPSTDTAYSTLPSIQPPIWRQLAAGSSVPFFRPS